MSEAWGLDLATMRWEAVPSLVCARSSPACCAVRDALAVLSGWAQRLGPRRWGTPKSRSHLAVEMLSKGEGAFVELPPLSCGTNLSAVAIEAGSSPPLLRRRLD